MHRNNSQWVLRGLSALLLSTALASCDLANPYEKPATPALPQKFNEAPVPSQTVTPTWPNAEWWRAFQSEELNGLMQEALSANDDLSAAVARVREANAQATIAGAPLLPTVDASANASRSVALKKTPTSPAHGKSYSAGVNASYEIDFWGKNRSAAESAEALADASVFDQQTVQLTVTSSVANTYFDWLATNERIRIAQQNLEAAQKLLDALNRQFNAGLVSRLDLVQQQNLVDTQQAAIPPLQLRAAQDRNALAILLGRLPEALTPPSANFDSITLPNVPAGLPSELLARRPDVQTAEANLRSAHADINQARAAFFPSISLTGGLNYASTALSKALSPGSGLLSYSADLAQPIFNNGALSGQLEYSHAREEELLADYHKSIVSAFADTEDALAALTYNKAQDNAQAAAEASAQQAYTLSQRQFEGGIVDITSVLNTQRSLFSASDARLQTRLAYLNAVVGVYNALGGGWKIEEN